jgi:hypothetical protein
MGLGCETPTSILVKAERRLGRGTVRGQISLRAGHARAFSRAAHARWLEDRPESRATGPGVPQACSLIERPSPPEASSAPTAARRVRRCACRDRTADRPPDHARSGMAIHPCRAHGALVQVRATTTRRPAHAESRAPARRRPERTSGSPRSCVAAQATGPGVRSDVAYLY